MNTPKPSSTPPNDPRPQSSSVTAAGEPIQKAPGPVDHWPGDSPERRAREATDKTVVSTGPPMSPDSLHGGLQPFELAELLEGQPLGNFQLQQFIGGGGMGAVFRAHDTVLGRTVAVKVVASHHAADLESQSRFRNEAQSAARLDHENIARIFNVGEDRGYHYIVFEFIDGVNLRDLVERRGPLTLEDAIYFTLQVARALDHASKREIVHRDIKPSNVLITTEGRVKLVDMGLARLYHLERDDDELTASGVTLGTFDYISPEQARDPRTADVRSDLYSLGCTLYFTLTGQPPFARGTMLQKLLQHQGDRAPDPRQSRPELPPGLSRVLSKLLEKSPADRYQTPRELIADLYKLARETGVTLPATELENVAAPTPAPAWWRVHTPWMAPVALLLVFAAAQNGDWFGPTASLDLPPLHANVTRPSPAPREVAPLLAPTSTLEEPLPAPEPILPGAPPEPPPLTVASASPPVGAPDGEEAANPSRLAPSPPAPAGEVETTSAVVDSGVSNTAIAAGDASAPAVTGEAPAPAQNPPPAPEVLLVRPGSQTADFGSLEAAARAAVSGQVIELACDDLILSESLPLAGKRLTIRGAQGYFPRIVFQPSPGQRESSAALVQLSGGELTMINVQLSLELDQSPSPGKRWSLLELQDDGRLRLDRCWLTLHAPPQVGDAPSTTSFIHVRTSSGRPVEDGLAAASRPIEIQMADCLVRGEGTLLDRTASSQPVVFSWKNGLLAVSGRLVELAVDGAAAEGGPTQIDLQYLTAVARRGLVLESGVGGPARPPASIACRDSIVSIGPDAALVEQRSSMMMDDFDAGLVWRGDRVFYDNVTVFWRLVRPEEPPGEMGLGQWLALWEGRQAGGETMPQRIRPAWLGRAPAGLALYQVTPGNFPLVDDADNAALTAAGDGGPVGFRQSADLWPDLSAPGGLASPPAPASLRP